MQKRSPADASAGDSTDRSPKSRSEKRREDTRRRLMKATYEIIAKRGLEGLVIQDITEVAEVGYGSFYNHFTSKDAIVAAVIDASRDFAREIYRRLATSTSDRAEAFALELLACLRLSKEDKTWGWFILRTVLSGEGNRSGVGADLRHALDACIQAGILPGNLEMAYEVTGGLLLIGTLRLLREDLPSDYPTKVVQTILKYLCFSDSKIEAILSKPFPDLQLTPFLEVAA
ncbi:MAG: TetR/AcrR family transcriptional regulator [Rhodomicrobium sp.]